MRFLSGALLCALLALSISGPTLARKSYSRGHTYPKSSGLSGGGHGYPSSGGQHGHPSGGLSGGSPGYPSSGGLSGGGRGYPSSGGNHASSGGSHGYPSSGGLSGNSHHPNNHGYPAGKSVSGGQTTHIHQHYHYSPPQQISYTPHHGGAPVSYPVYRGTPPNYVYQYKDSGSKYGTLLAGLALLNLGTLAGTAYAISQTHHGSSSGSSYRAQPGEVCKFGLKKENGDYEETRIDCQLITSFIYQEQAKPHTGASNTTVITNTVTNVTTNNVTNGVPEAAPAAPVDQTVPKPLYEMLPNGTFVPVNVPLTNVTVNATNEAPAANDSNPMTSSVSVVTTNTTTTVVTDALDVKGKPVEVTSGMKCYVIRVSPTSNMKRSVPCDLLQTYAVQSLKRNSAGRNAPVLTVLAIVVATLVLN